MSPELALTELRGGLVATLWIAGPLLLVVLVVGVVVGVIQAATQINEQTMTFIPKIVAVFVTLLIFGPWIIELLVTFTTGILAQIATIGR